VGLADWMSDATAVQTSQGPRRSGLFLFKWTV
jgi:hypothetical protein